MSELLILVLRWSHVCTALSLQDLSSCGRSSSDFEFGLGSFSLLDEIVTGQEWAKFLNPNLSATSANQRPSEEPLNQFKIPPNPHNSGQSSVILNQQGGVNNQWSFRGTEASPASFFSMAQISPDAFQPACMDVLEGKQQQYAHREADQSEPMEHGHTISHMQSEDSGQQRRPPSFVKVLISIIIHNLAVIYWKRPKAHFL